MADRRPMNPQSNVVASKNLPLGTTAKVTNLQNGRSATVNVQDRGPYARGRVMDVSPSVADQLDLKKQGTALVEVKPITVPQPDGAVKLGAGAADATPKEVAQAAETTRRLTSIARTQFNQTGNVMARGGRRPGAGRKPNLHWKPAVLRMRSASAMAKAEIIANPGRDPLNYLVNLANDETAPRADRIICAKAVLPYLHPQLSATTIDAVHRLTDDLSQRSTADIERELQQLESLRLLTAEARSVEAATTINVEVDALAVDEAAPFDADAPEAAD